jgi:hypothetical protein
MAAIKRTRAIEYRLLIEHVYDDTVKKEGVHFLLETTKQFTNFSYQIDVEQSLFGSELNWRLHGLRAPSMNMPESGNAQFSVVYFDLPKTIKFTLMKKDNVQASAEIIFTSSGINVSDSIVQFLKIYTQRQDFENSRSSDAEKPEHKPDVHRKKSRTKQKRKKRI